MCEIRSALLLTLPGLVLKTGLTPSASGSAYLELEKAPVPSTQGASFFSAPPALKLTCTVHGPRPLPRAAPFTSKLLLTTHVKFAPFATRLRRGYLRDASERDLAVHLETALRGVIFGERWPKSGVDIIVTVLEGEEDAVRVNALADGEDRKGGNAVCGMMSILSGCITVASAAIVDAGLDCIDLVSGGVAAIVRQPAAESNSYEKTGEDESEIQIVLDPTESDHGEILSTCVVGYLQSRDEVTELWMSGSSPSMSQPSSGSQSNVSLLVDGAVQAAIAARHVLSEAIKESMELRMQSKPSDD